MYASKQPYWAQLQPSLALFLFVSKSDNGTDNVLTSYRFNYGPPRWNPD